MQNDVETWIMPTISKSRPTSLSLIALFWIVVGSIAALLGFIATLGCIITGGPVFHDVLNNRLGFLAFIFKHYLLLAVIQLAIGLGSIFAGIEFLKLHTWARFALEIVSWLGLLLLLGFVITLFVTIHSFEEKLDLSMLFGVCGSITFILGTPLVVSVYFLRSQQIRDVMTS